MTSQKDNDEELWKGKRKEQRSITIISHPATAVTGLHSKFVRVSINLKTHCYPTVKATTSSTQATDRGTGYTFIHLHYVKDASSKIDLIAFPAGQTFLRFH